MENFGWKGLGMTLYQRVWLSYKSTLIGLAIAAGAATLDYLHAVTLPGWAKTIVAITAAAFALVKERYALPAPDPTAKGSP